MEKLNKRIAKRIKRITKSYRGIVFLYELEPLYRICLREEETSITYKYVKNVIASAIYAPMSGPETYVFPSDENGVVKKFQELAGVRGILNPDQAIEELEYEVITDETIPNSLLRLGGDYKFICENKFQPGALIRLTSMAKLLSNVLETKPNEYPLSPLSKPFDENSIFMLLSPIKFDINYNLIILEFLLSEKPITLIVSSGFYNLAKAEPNLEDIEKLLVKVGN